MGAEHISDRGWITVLSRCSGDVLRTGDKADKVGALERIGKL